MDKERGQGAASRPEEFKAETRKLIQGSGLLTILGGALLIFVTILDLFTIDFNDLGDAATTPAFAFYHALSLLAVVLLMVGLVGLYAHQLKEANTLWLIRFLTVGFLAAFTGTALVVGVFWAQAFGSPVVAEVEPRLLEDSPPPWLLYGYASSILWFALGWVLFGVATFWAGVFSTSNAALLIIGAILSITPVPFTEPVFAAAIIWMGLDVFRGRRGR
jgi:hypothetical protein